MTKYREILRLYSHGISKTGIAASCECSRKTVAKVLDRAKELNLRWPLNQDMTDGVLNGLFYPDQEKPSVQRQPDLDYIHKEMTRPNVTLKLLWNEYCEQCRMGNELPLMYSQFCFKYQKYSETKRASMHIPRKPGEQIEVDWAGQTASVIDRDTGEVIPASVFVAVLSFSQYAYVEAFPNQKQESWIGAHINMYQFFGGVSKILIPDNLKTGVVKVSWYSPEINKVYHEMAEHYDTVVIPARVRKPKDKPNAEGTVGIISTWIIAALRNQKFFTFQELNKEIRNKLDAFNSKPFQKKEGSRLSVFTQEEKPFLMQLPRTPYELATLKIATVQFNYHISIDKMHYSVPYEYIKHKVDVRITHSVIEVFYHNHRICSHPRLYGRPGQYSTNNAHMPENHQNYAQWNADRFIAWSHKIGPNTEIVVRAILSSQKVEQQGYKSCMTLLKLADKYSVTRLESACLKVLSYTPNPSLKSVKSILTTGQDKTSVETPAKTSDTSAPFGFTRGADYYGRK
ncbi:MAG: IS21 family transposase [Erysipelotrichaceae bacterium]|nr:IS21 family transposase [Erysipelotrichaceae bacterium]